MRRAGQHARETTRRLALRALAFLGVIIVGGIVGAFALGFRSTEFVFLELGLIAAMLVIDRVVLPVIDRWDRGATGEEKVGALLAPLVDDGWHVIHDLDTGRGNIDHVLVGPGGLFTLETKSHGGRISVDRIDERMLRQAYAQRKWLERASGHKAEALLVFSRAFLDRPISRKRGVLVLPARMLCGHLRRRDVVLSDERTGELKARLASASP